MHRPRLNTALCAIIADSEQLHRYHGFYEAILFLLMHRVRPRLILRALAPLARRRARPASHPR